VNTPSRLTPAQKELLLDLLEVEELFRDGRLAGGTIASHVMYKMANRRGRTLPAPVAGKVQADHVFVGVFARTVNRLVSAGLLRRRSVRDDFPGLPYQWGFARHGKRDKDIFLTDSGREAAVRLRERESLKPMPLVGPGPAAAGAPRIMSADSGAAVSSRGKGPAGTAKPLNLPQVQYFLKPKAPVRKPTQVLTGQFMVKFPDYTITYLYTKRV